MKSFMTMSALALALLLPFMPVSASTSGFVPASATQTWNHGTYQVQRLSLNKVVDGPISLGDAVIVQTVSESCERATCSRLDAVILREGRTARVTDVPRGIFDLDQYRLNGNRVVWATEQDDRSNYWDAYELDLVTGEKRVLAPDFLFSSASEVRVNVAGSEVFLTPVFATEGEFTQSTVHRYDYEMQKPRIVTQRYLAQNEELVDLDLERDILLTRMTFPTGQEELWLTRLNPGTLYGIADRLVGTWTPSHEDILAPHFRDDGKIEYFRFFRREVVEADGDLDTVGRGVTNDILNWYRPIDATVFDIDNGYVWVNDQGMLLITRGDVERELGQVNGSHVSVDLENVYYSTVDGKHYVFNMPTDEINEVPFLPLDMYGTSVVGISNAGSVMFHDLQTSATINVGFGDKPALAGERSVYWRGIDGRVYEAFVSSVDVPEVPEGISALKSPNSPTVYLTDGTHRWTITRPSVYFSHFDSWGEIRETSADAIAQLRDMGVAAPAVGTLVKSSNHPTVYVMGADGALHWVVNEYVASNAFGTNWNERVINLPSSEITLLPVGELMDEVTDYARF